MKEFENLEIQGVTSCSPDFPKMINYFNLPEVQTAMHISPSVNWLPCSLEINTNYIRAPDGSYKLLPDIGNANVRILFYSGNFFRLIEKIGD